MEQRQDIKQFTVEREVGTRQLNYKNKVFFFWGKKNETLLSNVIRSELMWVILLGLALNSEGVEWKCLIEI